MQCLLLNVCKKRPCDDASVASEDTFDVHSPPQGMLSKPGARIKLNTTDNFLDNRNTQW